MSKPKWKEVLKEFTTLGRMAAAVGRGDYHLAAPQIAAILATLGYVASPIDAIPDVIPILGLSDDASVVALTVSSLAYELMCFRAWEHERDSHAHPATPDH